MKRLRLCLAAVLMGAAAMAYAQAPVHVAGFSDEVAPAHPPTTSSTSILGANGGPGWGYCCGPDPNGFVICKWQYCGIVHDKPTVQPAPEAQVVSPYICSGCSSNTCSHGHCLPNLRPTPAAPARAEG